MTRRIIVAFLLIIILSLELWAQEGSSYMAGEAVIRIKNPFTQIEIKDGVVNTNAAWFNSICIRNNIKDAIPVYKSKLNKYQGRYVIFFPVDIPVKALVDQLQQVKEVIWAEPNFIYRLCSDPNDAHFEYQWGPEMIHAPAAWDISSGTSDVVAAVIDVGMEIDHDDLESQLWENPDEKNGQTGVDDDGNGFIDDIHGCKISQHSGSIPSGDHGTMVGGIIGAQTNNTIGISGISGGGFRSELGIRLMAIDAYFNSAFPASFVAEAIRYAYDPHDDGSTEDGADIINMSLSGTSEDWFNKQNLVEEAVEDAFTYGRDGKGSILVAAAGNSGDWDYQYPGYFDEVIAVGGIKQDGSHWSGTSQYEKESGGMAPDIWAPGDGIGSIRTTVPFNTYTGEGPLDPEHYEFGKTSAAAPHVAGVTGLILSVNPDLTASQVKDILFSTTQANDIVNAHAALLKALDELPARKSISSQTTAYNGGRRMIKTGDDLFLVYESGNQIYITESDNNGSTWSDPPTRLSDGEGQNKFPSITGNSSEQFVIWQRYTGYSSGYHHYDLYFAKNTGSGWSTATLTNLSDIQFSTETNPLPVITYESSDRLLVCAKTSSAIRYVYSDNYGSSWTSAASISGTSSSHQNPGLSMRPATPATSVLVYDNGSAIYFNNRYSSNWSGSYNVSSGSGTIDNCYPSVEMDGNIGRNIAWQGFSLPLQNQVIVHRRNTGSFSIFDLNSTLSHPSITGHDNDKRSVVFYKSNQQIYRNHYNGSSWSLSFIASQGKNPNISTGNATAKYVWTDVSDSPYEIKLSNEQLPSGGLLKIADATAENPVENLIHHRSAILQDSVSSTLLWVELGELSLTDKAGNSNAISLLGMDDEKIILNPDSLFSYLCSEPVTLPSDADTVSW